MSTPEVTADTPTPTPAPANPARGNLRGQTTLAAEIDRWQALANNLAPQINALPGLAGQFAQFQTLLVGAIAARNQLNLLQADISALFDQRDQLLLNGGDLYSRLSLALRAIHGPASPRLKEFGLKPRQRTGRPRKTPVSAPPPPPPVEVTSARPATLPTA